VDTANGWKLQTRLDISNVGTVVIDHDNLAVGTNGKGVSKGVVSFYTRKGETWQLAPRTSNHDQDNYSTDLFGHIIALSGQVALIGSPNWSKASYVNIGPLYSGRAYVERYDGNAWNEEAQLTSSDEDIGANQFGESVALSGDLLAISSSNHDTLDYAPHHGTVYIFRHGKDGWQNEAKLKSPDASTKDGFGSAPLAFSQHTLVIGDLETPANSPNIVLDTGDKLGKPGTIKKAGAVYVYQDEVLQATLRAPDPVDSLNCLGSPDQYASSLAVSGDTMAIGAPGKDGGTGVVYVWKRQNNRWILDTELKGFHKQPDFNY
jgi:hypothetical protein